MKYLLVVIIGLFCLATTIASNNETMVVGQYVHSLDAKSTDDSVNVIETEKESTTTVDLVSEKYEPEMKDKDENYYQIHNEIVSEVNSGVFTHIVEFHSILSYCDGIPRNVDERQAWIDDNAVSSESDINVLDNEMEYCDGIPFLSFNEKEQLYRVASDMGVEQAELALAKLIPYDSKEKIDLLSRSAVWSEDASMMIAEIAIKNSGDMTSQERVFWMSVSDIKSTYADIYERNMSEQLLSLDDNDKLQTEKIINLWRSGNTEQMKKAIELLRQIQS